MILNFLASIEELPDEYFTQLINELMSNSSPISSDNSNLSDSEFANIYTQLYERYRKKYASYQIKPFPIYDKDGKEIQNQSSVELKADENGNLFFRMEVLDNEGNWLFKGDYNLNSSIKHFTEFISQMFLFRKKFGQEITDETLEFQSVVGTVWLIWFAGSLLPRRFEISTSLYPKEIEMFILPRLFDSVRRTMTNKGRKLPALNISPLREQLIRHIEKVTRDFLFDKDYHENFSKGQKKYLAKQYEKVFPHWKEMQNIQMRGGNWRRYIKANDMSDITDDLIEEFERGKDISVIAIEHAARREMLMKESKIPAKALALRKQGVYASGFSRSALFEFKKTGEELLKIEPLPPEPPELPDIDFDSILEQVFNSIQNENKESGLES